MPFSRKIILKVCISHQAKDRILYSLVTPFNFFNVKYSHLCIWSYFHKQSKAKPLDKKQRPVDTEDYHPQLSIPQISGEQSLWKCLLYLCCTVSGIPLQTFTTKNNEKATYLWIQNFFIEEHILWRYKKDTDLWMMLS